METCKRVVWKLVKRTLATLWNRRPQTRRCTASVLEIISLLLSQRHPVSPLIAICIRWDLLTKHGEEAFIKTGLQLVDLMESQGHVDCIHSRWPPFRCFRDMNWRGWQDRTGRCYRRTRGGRRKGGKRLADWSGGCTLKV